MFFFFFPCTLPDITKVHKLPLNVIILLVQKFTLTQKCMLVESDDFDLSFRCG